MRGHKYPKFPWSKFFKACRRQSNLLLVDEHRTSALCSSCGFKGASSAKLVTGPSQCFRTKRCPEGSCRFSVAVGRDGGSARSILRITRYIMVRFFWLLPFHIPCRHTYTYSRQCSCQCSCQCSTHIDAWLPSYPVRVPFFQKCGERKRRACEYCPRMPPRGSKPGRTPLWR